MSFGPRSRAKAYSLVAVWLKTVLEVAKNDSLRQARLRQEGGFDNVSKTNADSLRNRISNLEAANASKHKLPIAPSNGEKFLMRRWLPPGASRRKR
jgi:hypothetical protein